MSDDFEQAFQKMRSAALLCMGLIETALNDPNSNSDTMMAGVDAICEAATRDVKAIWKRRYTLVANGVRFKGMLQSRQAILDQLKHEQQRTKAKAKRNGKATEGQVKEPVA